MVKRFPSHDKISEVLGTMSSERDSLKLELRCNLHWFDSVYYCFAAGLDGLKRSKNWTQPLHCNISYCPVRTLNHYLNFEFLNLQFSHFVCIQDAWVICSVNAGRLIANLLFSWMFLNACQRCKWHFYCYILCKLFYFMRFWIFVLVLPIK